MENTVSTQDTGSGSNIDKSFMIRGIASSIFINAVLAFLIYWALTTYTHTSEFLALVLSSVPSIIDSIVSLIRRKRIDLLAGIVLMSIAVSLILITLGGSPKLLLIRESFFTVATGIAYLVSLLFPRPLAFYFARYFVTGNHPENIPWFNSLWQYKQFRSSMRVTTVVWGVGFLFEAVVRTILVFTLSITQFLIISPFVLYGIIVGIIVWTFIYSSKGRKRGEEMRQRMLAEQQSPSSESAL